MRLTVCRECGKDAGGLGAQMSDGSWTCSEECWEIAALAPGARKRIEAAARLDAARKMLKHVMRHGYTIWSEPDDAALARIVGEE